MKYALRRGFMNPLSIIINCAAPLAFVFFSSNMPVAQIGANREFYLIAMMIMWGAFIMSKSVQHDKMEGVLIRILAGPVTLRGYLMQNFFAALVPMIGISILISAIGMLVNDWGFMFSIGLALCYIMLSTTSIGLSFAWSCLFKDKENSAAGVSVLITTVAAIGGFFLPLAILPQPIYYLGALFPAHWASRAIEVLLEDGMVGMYWVGLAAMALFSVAFILFGGKRRLV